MNVRAHQLPPPGRAAAGARATAVAVTFAFAVVGGATGCAEPVPAIVIVQNQKAALNEDGTACLVPAELADPRLNGIFDVDLDGPYPYMVYPLVESRLASVKTLGGIERNAVSLRAIRVTVRPPSGVDPRWDGRCPGVFDFPTSTTLEPGQLRALAAEGLGACHAVRLRELIAAGEIPADLGQVAPFTLDLQAVADRSGSELVSAVFPFAVRVCAGCLQRDYPMTPTCATSPKPNPDRGNPCNIAQDFGPVRCCEDASGALVCPAPDM